MPKTKALSSHKHVFDYVKQTSGQKALKIVKTIGTGTTDEAIEKKTKFKMSEIRTILNQLHNHGIVEYTREKNLANGWFTYTWKINMDRAMRNFLSAKQQEYRQLKELMNTEEGAMFYECRKGCSRFAFEKAIETKFKCPSCNTRMNFSSNKDKIKGIDEKISVLEQIITQQNAFNASEPKQY